MGKGARSYRGLSPWAKRSSVLRGSGSSGASKCVVGRGSLLRERGSVATWEVDEERFLAREVTLGLLASGCGRKRSCLVRMLAGIGALSSLLSSVSTWCLLGDPMYARIVRMLSRGEVLRLSRVSGEEVHVGSAVARETVCNGGCPAVSQCAQSAGSFRAAFRPLLLKVFSAFLRWIQGTQLFNRRASTDAGRRQWQRKHCAQFSGNFRRRECECIRRRGCITLRRALHSAHW